MTTDLCPDDRLQALIGAVQTQDQDAVGLIETLLSSYPDDARLHFLKGSTLAGEGRLIEAHASLSKAVEIAPDYAIARFQLGFFQLTSGEADNAMKTWARLDGLPDDHYIKTFVVGLRHLIRDEIADCVERLRQGIDANDDNPPLNDDMRLIIEQVTPLIGTMDGDSLAETSDMTNSTDEATSDNEDASLTSFILNQQSTPTRH